MGRGGFTLLEFINKFNFMIFLVFMLLYAYQIVYIFVVLFTKKKEQPIKKQHKFAIITSARNESTVIGQLLQSINAQNYPSELIDVFVIADNCTDDTAEVARQNGAYVFERNDTEHVGKGFALDYIFHIIHEDFADKHYEGYMVFDSDNLLDENYVAEINKVFDQGYRVITSYRNSKNYDSNWISAGYALWFLREAKFLNNARMLLHTSCAISGTGFLIHADIIKKRHGWKYNLLTEDIEFTIDNVTKGELIGYCGKAKFYDEQPVTFKQSWHQRLRWSKGFYQVFGQYGTDLFQSIFRKASFACYDMFMTIMPALFITLGTLLMNVIFLVYALNTPDVRLLMVPVTVGAIIASFTNFYLMLFAVGLITLISEWREIYAKPAKKILYLFTFPLFIFTYIPISIVALYKKVRWIPIKHTISKSVEDFKKTSM